MGKKCRDGAYHREMGRERHDCAMFPAWGAPPAFPVEPVMVFVPPTPARPGPLPATVRLRHPCRILPAVNEETVRAYAVIA